MTVLNVGARAQYQHIQDAINAAHPGDTIDVQAGTYNDEYFTVDKPLTIEAVNGTVTLTNDQQIPNGKAEAVIDANLTITGFEFSGAKVADGNGAGIRYEAGKLVVDHCYFYDNQDGILGGPSADGTVVVKNSEFSHNGTGDGYTHALYIGDIASLTVEDSYFHDTPIGHYIKSRAESTLIENNRIVDGATGTSSYNIDVPDGGATVVKGNVIEQGPGTDNPAIIHFGGETSTPYSNSSLLVEGNTILNDYNGSHTPIGVANQTSVVARISDNHVWGLTSSEIASGPNAQSGTDYLASEPAVDTSSPWHSSSASSTPGSSGDDSGAAASSPPSAPAPNSPPVSTPTAPTAHPSASSPADATPASDGMPAALDENNGTPPANAAAHPGAHPHGDLPGAHAVGEGNFGGLHGGRGIDHAFEAWLDHLIPTMSAAEPAMATLARILGATAHGNDTMRLSAAHELALADVTPAHAHGHADFFVAH